MMLSMAARKNFAWLYEVSTTDTVAKVVLSYKLQYVTSRLGTRQQRWNMSVELTAGKS
jgi:hypothetical protein